MKTSLYFLITLLSFLSVCNATNGQVGRIVTVAGGGTIWADGIPATAAAFVSASGIWTEDGTGNVYVSDEQAYRIRRIDGFTGIISTVAGNGVNGFSGDGGLATNAKIGYVSCIRLDAQGNLYLGDYSNGRVRKVSAATGIITTVAGGGTLRTDGIPATNSALSFVSFTIDLEGNIYVGDSSRIRLVNATTGRISTIVGGGTLAVDSIPATSARIYGRSTYMMTDASKNLYYLEGVGTPIRKYDVRSGLLYIVVGGGVSLSDSILATQYNLRASCFGFDPFGNFIIMDIGSGTIRSVDMLSGMMYKIAGGGTSLMDSVPASSANLVSYHWLHVDAAGNVYISNHAIGARNVRRINSLPVFSGINTISDSFSLYITKECNLVEFTARVRNYVPGQLVKTWYGDGTREEFSVAPGFLGLNGFVRYNHSYDHPGNYTIKSVLYDGGLPIDSLSLSHVVNFCRTMAVKLYYDPNNNCVKESSERYNMHTVKVEIDSNGVPIDTVAATSGFNYSAFGVPGDIYTFKLLDLPAGYSPYCPATGILTDTLVTVLHRDKTNWFGMTCNATTGYDLSVTAVTAETGVADQSGHVYVQNRSCYPIDADITVNFSSKYAYTPRLMSPLPASHTDSSFVWHMTLLGSGANQQEVGYYVVDANPITGRLPIGTIVTTSVSVTPTVSDRVLRNNYCVNNDEVRAGSDPNYIAVLPAGCIPSAIDPVEMQYTVHFENTGNDTAHNIYVMDTLSDNLDLSTFELLSVSAEMYTTTLKNVGGKHVLKFDFPGINLPDSTHHGLSDGAVVYKIKTKPGLPTGAALHNNAGIYFDYNDVVMTNTAITNIGCPVSVPNALSMPDVRIYPNPVGDMLNISLSPGNWDNLVITNVMGQIMLQYTIVNSVVSLNVSAFTSGVYYITIAGEQGRKVEKLIKR